MLPWSPVLENHEKGGTLFVFSANNSTKNVILPAEMWATGSRATRLASPMVRKSLFLYFDVAPDSTSTQVLCGMPRARIDTPTTHP